MYITTNKFEPHIVDHSVIMLAGQLLLASYVASYVHAYSHVCIQFKNLSI